MQQGDERKLHLAFEASLLLKGLDALGEIVAGVFAYFAPPPFVLSLVEALTREELNEDPRDFVATHLLMAARHLSIGTQHFVAWYLFGHGIVKLWLVTGLWRKRLGYYPAAIGIFGLFILYQLYRFTFTHSPMLIAITGLDVIVIALTWFEYRNLRGSPG